MIKLGRLFLDGGTWEGRLVVSERWVPESTAWRQDTGEAIPWGTEFLFVVPERDTTIAAATRWSGVRGADANFMLVLRTIFETLLPALG